jgi:hypothetical protein
MKKTILYSILFLLTSHSYSQSKKWGAMYGSYERVKDGSMKIEDAIYLAFYDTKKIPNNLKNFINTSELKISNCPKLNNVDNICCLSNLERLIFFNCDFGNLKNNSTFLSNLPKLSKLEITGSNFSNIANKLSNLKSLTHLEIGNNENQNLNVNYKFLEDLPVLEDLYLAVNLNTCYKNLISLKHIKRISLYDSEDCNNILVEIFSNLINVEEINLIGAQISAIPFNKMPSLKKLKISTNKEIKYYMQLHEISTLEELHIGNYINNPTNEMELKKLIDVNPKLRIFKSYNKVIDKNDFDSN